MTDMPDQPAQQPRAGAASAGATAAPGSSQGSAPAGAQRGYVPRPAPGYDDVAAVDREPSGAVIGLTILAAVFMMVSGVLSFFEGLANIIRGTFFVVLPNYTFNLSATGWGTLQIILGVLVFVAGAALFADKTWARITGVVLASFAILANFLWLPYYPVWAIVVIALSAFVIWALLTPRHW